MSKSDSSCDKESPKGSLDSPPPKRQKKGDSSCSDSSYGSSWSSVKSRFSTSQWKREDLEELGVFYGKDPKSLTDLFDQLRKSSPRIDYPTYVKKFAEYAKEAMPFSVNIGEIQEIKKATLLNLTHKEVSIALQKSIKGLIDLEKDWESAMDQSTNKKLVKLLLKFWIVNVFNFLTTTQNLIEKLFADQSSLLKSGKKTEDIRESSFTKLIMKFTEVFFLNPEQGESKKTDIMIRNKKVGCIPDVRFFQERVSAESSEALVMLIELCTFVYQYCLTLRCSEEKLGKNQPVELQSQQRLLVILIHQQVAAPQAKVKKSALRSFSSEEGTWIQGKLKREVLGQIGAEMLVECSNSAFCPEILGIVCMRTEVIFMILNIEFSHLRAIMQNKSVEGNNAHIEYSRSYDILNAEDREEMAEFLLWLGCVQKKNFHRYYLRE